MTHALPLPGGKPTANAKPNRKQRRLEQRRMRRAGASTGQERLLAEAFAHHSAGRLAEAEPLYRKALGADPRDFTALSRLGALCAQTRRHPEAVELLQSALAIDPGDAASQMNLGFAFAAQGRVAEADAAFREGVRLDPSDPDTLKNYGAWCQQQGRLEEAITALEDGLDKAPNDPRRRGSLALALAGSGRLDAAAQQYERALAAGGDAEIHANYGVLLAHSNRPSEALYHLALGFERPGASRDYQILFATVVQEASPQKHMPELDRAFQVCLSEDAVDWQRLSPAIGTHIWTKYMDQARLESANGGRATKVHLDGILADPLLIALLRQTVSINIGLELLLVPLRRQLLAAYGERAEQALPFLPFMAAFAMQCHNNAYVFPVSPEEAETVDRLIGDLSEEIAAFERPDAAFEARLALAVMYRPVHSVQGFERLADLSVDTWSEAVRPLIELTLTNPAKEQRLRGEIDSFGAIDDAVSQAVRSQYEENPYPRWVSQPRQIPARMADHLRRSLPGIEPPDWQDEGLPCLVAGCGTGRHPIGFAARFPQAAVTAVDLSLSSLAYAKRMAQRDGIENIEFRQGDLQQIGALDRRFQVIECCGVLHHLLDPERGLEALLDVLAPDGYLRLALYSQTARQAINVARERVREMGLQADTEAIRAFRGRLVTRQEPGLEQFVTLTDFFDLDSFRDLVFHVQEHQYDIPEIAAMLRRHGLEFLGFTQLRATDTRAFAQRFPTPGAERDLDCWAEYEHATPTCFLGMYDFWCRRSL